MNDIKQIEKKSLPSASDRKTLMAVLEKLANGHSRLELTRAYKLDLNVSEARCLTAFDRERYLTVKGLSQSLNLVKSRVVRIIDGLADKSLVERYPDPRDGRICLIGLTSKGQRKLAELLECCKDSFDDLWVSFDHPEKQRMIGAMEELARHIDRQYSGEL